MGTELVISSSSEAHTYIQIKYFGYDDGTIIDQLSVSIVSLE